MRILLKLCVLLGGTLSGAVSPWGLMYLWPEFFGRIGDPANIDCTLMAMLAMTVGIICGGILGARLARRVSGSCWQANGALAIVLSAIAGAVSAVLVSC